MTAAARQGPGQPAADAQKIDPLASYDDAFTLIAIGAGVAVCASLAHEALGHGTGCLVDRGTITLMTFLVFRCAGAGALADGGGPVGAFVVGGLCLAGLVLTRPKPSAASLFAYALGVQTMFWVAAQMVRDGLDGSDDWGHVAADLGWRPGWHGVVIAAGVLLYWSTIAAAVSLGRPLAAGRPARLLIPYASATVSAVMFGVLWHRAAAASALDGFLTFGIAPLGTLPAIRSLARLPVPVGTAAIRRNAPWLIGTVIAILGFALTIARGIGRLA